MSDRGVFVRSYADGAEVSPSGQEGLKLISAWLCMVSFSALWRLEKESLNPDESFIYRMLFILKYLINRTNILFPVQIRKFRRMNEARAAGE